MFSKTVAGILKTHINNWVRDIDIPVTITITFLHLFLYILNIDLSKNKII